MKLQQKESSKLFLETNNIGVLKSKSSFLETFFNIFYICGIIPFSVQQEFNGSYCLTSSCFSKKLISGINHGTALGMQIALTISFGFHDFQTPSLISIILHLLNNIFGIMYVLVAINLLWNRKEKLVKVLECTKTSIQQGRLARQASLGVLVISVIYTTFTIYDHMIGSHIHMLQVKKGPLVDFLTEGCISSSNSHDGGCTWWMWALYLLYKLALIFMSYASTFFFFNHFFFLLLALSMLDLAEEFRHNLPHTESINQGIEVYLMLKMKVKVVNDCVGPLILSYFASCLSFLLEGPDIMMGFKTSALSEKIVYILCILATISWILFAQYHENAKNALENWLEQNLLRIPEDIISHETRMKLMTIMHEVEKGSLAISCQYFGITNKFLSSTLGLLVTYLIVGLQTQPKLSTG